MNLGAFLERQHIVAATVYGLASRLAQRIDLETVGKVLDSLPKLTGTIVQMQDILETLDAAGQQRRREARSRIAAPSDQAPGHQHFSPGRGVERHRSPGRTA